MAINVDLLAGEPRARLGWSRSRHYIVAMTTDEFECPFCGEPGEIAADYDPDAAGDQVFVQDCAVCCRPWTVTVHVGADGEVSFDVQRS